jgi:hypothetical protein
MGNLEVLNKISSILNSSTTRALMHCNTMSTPLVSTPSGYLIHNLRHLLEAMKEPVLTVNLCQCLQEISAVAPPMTGLVIHWIKLVPKEECPARKFKILSVARTWNKNISGFNVTYQSKLMNRMTLPSFFRSCIECHTQCIYLKQKHKRGYKQEKQAEILCNLFSWN